jgi:hypothetical protein
LFEQDQQQQQQQQQRQFGKQQQQQQGGQKEEETSGASPTSRTAGLPSQGTAIATSPSNISTEMAAPPAPFSLASSSSSFSASSSSSSSSLAAPQMSSSSPSSPPPSSSSSSYLLPPQWPLLSPAQLSGLMSHMRYLEEKVRGCGCRELCVGSPERFFKSVNQRVERRRRQLVRYSRPLALPPLPSTHSLYLYFFHDACHKCEINHHHHHHHQSSSRSMKSPSSLSPMIILITIASSGRHPSS